MTVMRTCKVAVAILVVTGLLTVRSASAADNILKPANKAENWRFEQHEDGKGKISVDGDAILFDVTNVDGTEWHVQAFQTPLAPQPAAPQSAGHTQHRQAPTRPALHEQQKPRIGLR